MTPRTARAVRSRSLNSFTEASSIQSLKLYVRGELSLTWTNQKEGLDALLFLCYSIFVGATGLTRE